MVGAALAGAGTYFALQARLHAPEIAWLRTGLAGLGDRDGAAELDEVNGP